MNTGFTVHRFLSAEAFLDRAESWLLQNEAANNLTLGVTRALAAGDDRYDQPIYLAVIERGNAVVGCAFRTPPYRLCVSDLPAESISPLVDDVSGVYSIISGIRGPGSAAANVARTWCDRHGGRYESVMEQSIYSATRASFPSHPPTGHLRRAEESDLKIVVGWAEIFLKETGLMGSGRETVDRMMSDGSLYVWEDDGPRCMLAAVGPTPRGIRIGYVYTPVQFRGSGYASIATATLTARQFESGRRFCFLFTDKANPTSNAIYRRIGYEKICDVIDVDLII